MSIALNKQSQKLFSNAVTSIKKYIQEGKLRVEDKDDKVIAKTVKLKRKRPERGVVYLGHIPHGFYEDEMKSFFNQFGTVTKARVFRSEKTGRSKGYGFVQFRHPDVAKIVAETMNNYLMCNRLLKAEYIPPERQHYRMFSGLDFSEKCYPKLFRKIKTFKQKNKNRTDEKHAAFCRKQVKKIEKLKQILLQNGVYYDFKFSNVPSGLDLEIK